MAITVHDVTKSQKQFLTYINDKVKSGNYVLMGDEESICLTTELLGFYLDTDKKTLNSVRNKFLKAYEYDNLNIK